MLFFVRKRMRFTGRSLFPVVPHVLDIFVVLEHIEHLLEKMLDLSIHHFPFSVFVLHMKNEIVKISHSKMRSLKMDIIAISAT